MLFVRIKRYSSSTASLRDNLQPCDVLEYPKKSSFIASEGGGLWRHKSAPGTITWSRLDHDVLECEIDGGDPQDDWEIWGHLAGYLCRNAPYDDFDKFEFQK